MAEIAEISSAHPLIITPPNDHTFSQIHPAFGYRIDEFYLSDSHEQDLKKFSYCFL
jgi:hypothetical protein